MNGVLLVSQTAERPTRTLGATMRASDASLVGSPFMGWLAGAFVAVGATDLLLGWIPLQFGNPQWEFGSVSAFFDGLPVFSLGLALLLCAAVERGSAVQIRVIGTVFIVLAAIILSLAALYATLVPLALKSLPDPAVRQGLLKAISKTFVQAIAYPVAFGWIGIKAYRRARSVSSNGAQ